MVIDSRELTLSYDTDSESETIAVQNVDITLKRNEFTGLTGPSGSGKSSLLYLLSGLKAPTSGMVFYDNVDISLWKKNKLEGYRLGNFGFIFQRHYLLSHLTILENILVPVNSMSTACVKKADDLMKRLELDISSSKRPYELSVGERQKAAIARALINEPKVIFADEPTASLDIDSAMLVMDILNDYKKQCSIIIVTHDLKILKNADNIIKMRDGKVISTRTKEENPIIL